MQGNTNKPDKLNNTINSALEELKKTGTFKLNQNTQINFNSASNKFTINGKEINSFEDLPAPYNYLAKRFLGNFQNMGSLQEGGVFIKNNPTKPITNGTVEKKTTPVETKASSNQNQPKDNVENNKNQNKYSFKANYSYAPKLNPLQISQILLGVVLLGLVFKYLNLI